MRIVTQMWLGMAILTAGYVTTVVGNDIIARRNEAFLVQLDGSMVPAVRAAQEAVMAFKQEIFAYQDCVVSGDQTMLVQAASGGTAVVDAMRAISALEHLAAPRREAARHLAEREIAFEAEAVVVYGRLAITPTATEMMTRAAHLQRQTADVRAALTTMESQLRDDVRSAIEGQQRQISIQRQVSDLVLVAILLATIAGIVALTIRWSSRLAALMRASTRLAQGDYETPVEAAGSDEVGHLGSGFEQMRRAISQRDLSLRVFNDTLEQQIRDRTRELEERNRELSTEIAVRHRAEENLRAAHQEAESMLGSLGAALIGLDGDDRITRWNGAAERLFGYAAETAIGRTLAETGIRCDWAEIFLAIEQCVAERRTVEIAALRYDGPVGEPRWLSLLASPSHAQDGSRPGRGRIVLLATDITQRRADESERTNSAKLESIGQLAAGIAHEINTPIQFVGDNLRFLADAHGSLKRMREVHQHVFTTLRAHAPVALVEEVDVIEQQCDVAYLDEEVPKAITQSLEGVVRVAEIIRAMKAFSHQDSGAKAPCDLNAAVRTTIAVARNEYKYIADVVADLDDELPPVHGHAGGIHQVLLNLLVNAAHAVADVVQANGSRGTITLQTRRDGSAIEFRITDTGTGIPESVQSKIFTPFFTTKAVGKGTGQGLSLAHTIVVKQHGGQISFQTAVGQGTTFIVRLPIG